MFMAIIRIGAFGICIGTLAMLANCSEPTAEADSSAGRKPAVTGVIEPPVSEGMPYATPSGTPDVTTMTSIEWAKAVSFELGNNVPLPHCATISIQAFRETVGTQVRVGSRLMFSHAALPGASGRLYLNASGLKTLIAAVDELDTVRFVPSPANISAQQTWLSRNNLLLQKSKWDLMIWAPGHTGQPGGFWAKFEADQFKKALSKAIEEIDSLAKTPPSIEVGR